MSIKLTDHTMPRNDDFGIWTAQRSFHELLVQNHIYGDILLKILELHAQYLTECFVTAQSEYKIDTQLLRSATHVDIENIVKRRHCDELADKIYEKLTVHIHKGKFETTSRISVGIFTKEIKDKIYVPISRPITLFGEEE